jgi:hypothetical protein
MQDFIDKFFINIQWKYFIILYCFLKLNSILFFHKTMQDIKRFFFIFPSKIAFQIMLISYLKICF